MTRVPMHNKVNCYIAYTNPETHKVILDNLHRSPLYGGDIQRRPALLPVHRG